MSELAKTIDRLEQWADHWEPHQPAEFIANLRTLIAAAKAISRAVEVLQGLEDVSVTMDDEGSIELMVSAHAVDYAVAILKGESNDSDSR